MAGAEKKPMSNNAFVVLMVLITVVVLGATALATKFLYGSISLNSTVIKAKDLANNQVKTDVTDAPQLVSAYSALGSQQTLLADALPTTMDFPSVLVELQNITNSAGLTLKSVAPETVAGVGISGATESTSSSPVAPPMAQEFPLEIQVDCTYASLQTMLNDLQMSARPIRVTGVQLSGTGGSLTAEINMVTYYQSAAVLPFGTETVK